MLYIKQVNWHLSIAYIIYKEGVTSCNSYIGFYIQTKVFSNYGYDCITIFLDCNLLCDLYGGHLNDFGYVSLNEEKYIISTYVDSYDNDKDYLIYSQKDKEFIPLLLLIQKVFIDDNDYANIYHNVLLRCITDLLLLIDL